MRPSGGASWPGCSAATRSALEEAQDRRSALPLPHCCCTSLSVLLHRLEKFPAAAQCQLFGFKWEDIKGFLSAISVGSLA